MHSRTSRYLAIVFFVILLAPLLVHAVSSIPLEKRLSGDQLPAAADRVTVSLYESPDATEPVAMQTFFTGEWQLVEHSASQFLQVAIDSDTLPEIDQPLWYEIEADGVPIGQRELLREVTAGVTFALGNALNMDGNVITDLAMPVAPVPLKGTDAANRAYVDNADITGNAATATQLAADGANCNNGEYPLGVDKFGVVQGCTPDATDDTVSSEELDAVCNQDGKILKRSGGSWACASGGAGSGDNLGDHTATQNLQLGSHWLSGDGGDEGVRVDADGKVGIGSAPGSASLVVGGVDGLLATGAYESGVIPIEGAGTRLMWYPGKAAFRAGKTVGSEWDDANIGDFSFATGRYTKASGLASTAMGVLTTASGNFSTAMSYSTTAKSLRETAVGSFNTDYTPASTTAWNEADRLFVIGNGTHTGERSDAMVVLKNGNTGIGHSNPEYRLQVEGSSDCAPTSGGSLVTGSTDGENLCFDANEITARTDGVASQLHLQADGGPTQIGGTLELIELGTSGGTDLCRNGSNILAACSSSARYKDNIEDLPLGLAALDRLRPVSFDWKDGQGHDLGFVAEAVAAVDPVLATYRDGEVEGVKYKQLTAVLVNAVKEQQQQIAALTAELQQYRTLAAEVASLKQSLGLVVVRRD